VILSDDPRASDKIGAFTHGTQRIAVCVRMVSEGVDVPRAACLAWMTSYRTPLFFAQGVGRVVRARTRGEAATVFLPAVRPLLALAAEMEQERNHVIPPPPAGRPEDVLDVVRAEPEPSAFAESELVDAEASFAHVLHGGRAVMATPLSEADEDYLGLPGILTPEQTAAVLARRDSAARRRATGAEAVPPSAETAAWRAGTELRCEVNRLVGVLAARTGARHRQIHGELRRAVPGPASAAAGVEVLEQRRDHLMTLLGGAG
jgi:hypothetical protein